MINCKDCKHFSRSEDCKPEKPSKIILLAYGECLNKKVINGDAMLKPEANIYVGSKFEDPEITFEVNENFGCVMGEAKTN